MEHRYYIGLQLPGELRDWLADIQGVLFDQELILKPLEPHITLLPPPALAHVDPEELVPKLRATAGKFWPLPVGLTVVGNLGAHAIVVAVESRQLHELRGKLSGLVPPHPSLQPKFQPHVTLAQALRGKRLPVSLLEDYRRALQDALPQSFDATQLTLFRWEGPRFYTAEPL